MSRDPDQTVAVALHYEKPGVPHVIAKGHGELGQTIIDTARAHGVPLTEDPLLAAALSQVELGDAIPLELYKAVAEVLAFVLRVARRA